MFKWAVLFCVGTVYGLGTDLLDEMSLEEKVGQVLVAHFHGLTANQDAEILVQEVKVGGIIYYNWCNGLTSAEQVGVLSKGLEELSRAKLHPIPLWIMADQEGGVVARLQTGFTSFPGNRALGQTEDPKLAFLAARAMGEELRMVGINMNLAPVVDVNNNPRNPIIGVRSFGDSVETVVSMGEQALLGYGQASVMATLKHFPGYGDVSVDPHEDLPVIHKSKEELERLELVPFARLAPLADAVMTAHVLVPALDPENCATLSAKTLQVLRQEIGFQGVIIADSLVMDGVLNRCRSVEEAAIRALEAGCDLLILGGKLLVGERNGFELTTADVVRVHSAIVQAVKDGRIEEKRLDSSVTRILQLKEKYLHQDVVRDPKSICGLEHRILARRIADLSIRTREQKSDPREFLENGRVLVVAPDVIERDLLKTSICNIGKKVELCFFKGLNPTAEEIARIKNSAKSCDVVVVCSYNAWKNHAARDLTRDLLHIGKPLILWSVRDPLDGDLFPEADLVFTSFSPTRPSLQAICDQMVVNFKKIADKIWNNECGGSEEKLTYWGEGEDCASLGIGHFIWYPQGVGGSSREQFPLLINFLVERGVILPPWLVAQRGCPWKNREEFYREIRGQKMQDLRRILADTVDLQALFIVRQLEEDVKGVEDPEILEKFYRLKGSSRGVFALIDYANFKGLGLSSKERYQGQGWGLVQVLEGISLDKGDILEEFVRAAKEVLTQRVELSPPLREEKRWLQGWKNRVERYID